MDDELNPHESERVRRLLADARHTEPIPDDVAARIDRALADAAAEPATVAPVVPLAERRRKAGRLLLAAAVVVVGGVALGQVVGNRSADNEAADTSTAARESAPDQGQLPAPNRDDNQLQDNGNSAGAEDQDALPGAVSSTRRSLSKVAPRRIRPDRFAADAARLRPLATAQNARKAQAYVAEAPHAADLAQRDACEAGAWGGGRYVRVVFDREAGWLVYRAPRGGTQVVDLFLCGDDSPERSATLPFD